MYGLILIKTTIGLTPPNEESDMADLKPMLKINN